MSREEVKAFAKRIKKLYIEHDEVNRIWKKFDSLRVYNEQLLDSSQNEQDTIVDEDDDDEKDPRHLMLMGLSGVGKSQIGKRYAKKYPGYTLETDEEHILIKPVIYVELPFPFTQQHFYTYILNALGTDNYRKDTRINHLKDRVLHLLKKQRTELIIFDEMNFIVRTKRFDNQEGMEMFKDLTNKCQLSIVCMGTPQIEMLRNMEDEYIRRFGKDTIKHFDTCDEAFCNLLNGIEEDIQPYEPIGLGDLSSGLPQLLHLYTQGRIGYLHLMLKESYRLLGVFDNECDDFSKAILSVNILTTAKYNLFGESDHLVTPKAKGK